MTAEMKETLYGVIERWGFPTLVAIALGYFLRQDILLPMMEDQRVTQQVLRDTQNKISDAVAEQTQLIRVMNNDHVRIYGDKLHRTSETE